jgi:hypothetical protein
MTLLPAIYVQVGVVTMERVQVKADAGVAEVRHKCSLVSRDTRHGAKLEL